MRYVQFSLFTNFMNPPNLSLFFILESLSGGGAERVTLDLIQHFPDYVSVTLITFSSHSSYSIDPSIRHINLDSHNWLNPCLIKKLRHLYFAYKPDVILSNTRNVTVVSSLALFSLPVKIIAREANTYHRFRKSTLVKFFAQLLYTFSYFNCDHIIVNSPDTQTSLQNFLFFNPLNISTLPNPLRSFNFEQDPEETDSWLCDPKIKVILVVGRLHAQKDPHLAISIFSHIFSRDPSFRLIFLGDGELLESLKHYALELGLKDFIHFKGFVEDYSSYLESSFALLHTARYEGFGNVIIESLSFGLPVFTLTSPGGISWILKDGLYGYIHPSRDPLSSALSFLEYFNSLDYAYHSSIIMLYSATFNASTVCLSYLDAIVSARRRKKTILNHSLNSLSFLLFTAVTLFYRLRRYLS